MKHTITILLILVLFPGFHCHSKRKEAQKPAMYEATCKVTSWQEIANKSNWIDSNIQALSAACEQAVAKPKATIKENGPKFIRVENPGIDTAIIFTILNDSNK